jgi:copper oxidase (laccase) domain-containing protein
LVHCARESLNSGIIQKTINILHERNPKGEYLVYLGPGINKESYILPQKAIETLNADWDDFVLPAEDDKSRYHVDIKGYVLKQLSDSSIKTTETLVSDINTCTNPDYFSHYRATRFKQKNGRSIFTYKINK